MKYKDLLKSGWSIRIDFMPEEEGGTKHVYWGSLMSPDGQYMNYGVKGTVCRIGAELKKAWSDPDYPEFRREIEAHLSTRKKVA